MSERINISEKEITEVISKISLRSTNTNNYKVVCLYTNATTLDHVYLVCAHRVYAEDMEVLKRCLECNLPGYSVSRLEENANYMVIRLHEHSAISNGMLSYDDAIDLIKANSHVFHLDYIDTNYDEAAECYLDKAINGSVTSDAPVTSSHATVIARFYPEPVITEIKNILVSGGIDVDYYYGCNAFYLDGYSTKAYSTAYGKALSRRAEIVDDMQSLRKDISKHEPVIVASV